MVETGVDAPNITIEIGFYSFSLSVVALIIKYTLLYSYFLVSIAIVA